MLGKLAVRACAGGGTEALATGLICAGFAVIGALEGGGGLGLGVVVGRLWLGVFGGGLRLGVVGGGV